jgi:hypothetical protein
MLMRLMHRMRLLMVQMMVRLLRTMRRLILLIARWGDGRCPSTVLVRALPLARGVALVLIATSMSGIALA